MKVIKGVVQFHENTKKKHLRQQEVVNIQIVIFQPIAKDRMNN